MADEWNDAVPDNDELVSDLPDEHRDMKTNVKAVIEAEHTTLGDGNSGGLHKPGSARAFFQDAAPATNIDGSDFGAGDLGLLWIDSNATPDNQFNILTATTPTWTPISVEIIAVLLASSRQFAGNLIVDGTLLSTGIATLADKSKNATSAAPDADAQLVNKKYVDDLFAAKVALSAYTNKDSENNTLLKSAGGAPHAYLAATDGVVYTYNTEMDAAEYIRIYVGLTDDPVGGGTKIVDHESAGSNRLVSCVAHVAKGEYFEITTSGGGTQVIFWKSYGTLSKPVDQN